MSNFTPTQWTLEPPSRPDQLSGAVLQSLSRPIGGPPWGPVKSLVLGGLSFGILPLLAWPRKFRRFVVAEQQQMWHLAEWLRVRSGDDQAAQLRAAVRHSGTVPTLWLVPLALLLIIAANFAPWLDKPGMNLQGILAVTYAFGDARWHPPFLASWSHFPLAPWRLYRVWTICLALAYGSHWLHVQKHAADINRLLARINVILQRQDLPPVRSCKLGIGLRPLWLLAAGLGVIGGTWWAVPAALAGAIQQRYTRGGSMRVRGELARRVRTLLQRQRPAIDVPTPHRFRLTCRNHLCARPVPTGALFCPHCGTRLPVPLDAVA